MLNSSLSLHAKVGRSLAAFLILANVLVFIPLTVYILMTSGGEMGWGLLFLPVTFGTHLCLIPAILTWFAKREEAIGVALVFNILGSLWTGPWLALLVKAWFF